jgi:carbohydrate-binding DOMON domain-containing protein
MRRHHAGDLLAHAQLWRCMMAHTHQLLPKLWISLCVAGEYQEALQYVHVAYTHTRTRTHTHTHTQTHTNTHKHTHISAGKYQEALQYVNMALTLSIHTHYIHMAL